MSGMRDEDQLRRKPFNPVFMSIPLIDLAPWQPRLAPWRGAWWRSGISGRWP